MPKVADAVIVGGGITGLSLALELASASLRVTVLEENRFGGGATGNGFAWVNSSSKIIDEDYHRLNATGIDHYFELCAEFGEERIGWHGGGSLYWADEIDPSGNTKLMQRYDVLKSWKQPSLLLNSEEMETLEPNVNFSLTSNGLFCPAEGWLDTPRHIRFLIERITGFGAELKEFSPVTALKTDRLGAACSVETEKETYTTRRVILCAGVRNQVFLEMAAASNGEGEIPQMIRESPGLLVETEPLEEVEQIGRVLYPPSNRELHLRPAQNGGLLIGASDTDEFPPVPASSELLERARRVLRSPARLAPHAHRVCVRPVPIDSFPIIGEIKAMPGFSLLATHSGITLAPTLARLLALELLTGELSPLLQPYRPERFLPAL